MTRDRDRASGWRGWRSARWGSPATRGWSSLVAELGAVTVRDHLAAERDPDAACWTDVAARLAALTPSATSSAPSALGIRFVVPGDDEWPAQVDQLMAAETLDDRGGPPLGLWVRGPDAASTSCESRRGRRLALGDHLRHLGRRRDRAPSRRARATPVVSGAAFGIDQAAHRGALAAGGRTVAVLACGVDRAYPAAHRTLLDHLGEDLRRGLRAAPGRSPTRIRFLSRNRLIAALTRGTVVVEAAAAQRGAQHRRLGSPSVPAADVVSPARSRQPSPRASTS